MADYYRHIKALLTGEEFGVPRDRLDWTGYLAVLSLYRRTPIGERSQIIEAMTKIILGDKDWGLVADTIHLAYALGIKQVENTVRTFKHEKLDYIDEEWKPVVKAQIETFLITLKSRVS